MVHVKMHNSLPLYLCMLCYVSCAFANEELIVKTIQESKECTKKAENGDFLRVHYIGRFNDENGEIFDQSKRVEKKSADGTIKKFGKTFDFTLGTGQVIQGYDQGVPGMCEGEIRTLTVPPHLAYGEQGNRRIPPKSTLHFTVELMKIVKKEKHEL